MCEEGKTLVEVFAAKPPYDPRPLVVGDKMYKIYCGHVLTYEVARVTPKYAHLGLNGADVLALKYPFEQWPPAIRKTIAEAHTANIMMYHKLKLESEARTETYVLKLKNAIEESNKYTRSLENGQA